MEQPKWRKFEELVARIQRDLAGDALVTPNDKIVGKRSGVPRQIDISIRRNVGQFEILIVIDCKDYSEPLDVKSLEEFMGLAQDVGAHKAAMVSAHGFTETAKNRANDAGIELYRVIDTGDHPWKAEISIPAVCDFVGIRSFSLNFSGTGYFRLRTDIDFRELDLYTLDKTIIGKVRDLLHAKWDSGEFPKEPGHYENLDFVKNPVNILTDNEFYEMNVRANLLVERRLYFGGVPLKEISGLYEERTGALITRSITTESIEFAEVERSWRRIKSLNDLAVVPVLHLRCFDVYGTSK